MINHAMTPATRAWLTENEIVEAVTEHLQKAGWGIKSSCNTMQRGIDICAERGGVTLAVEAKGGAHRRQEQLDGGSCISPRKPSFHTSGVRLVYTKANSS
jgi:hypothetical protein